MFVKIYDYVNEASESENKNSSEISEQNGTPCRYVRIKIQKFIKIRIPLLLTQDKTCFLSTDCQWQGMKDLYKYFPKWTLSRGWGVGRL